MQDWRRRLWAGFGLACVAAHAGVAHAALPLPAIDKTDYTDADKASIKAYVDDTAHRMDAAASSNDQLAVHADVIKPMQDPRASAVFKNYFAGDVNVDFARLLANPKVALSAAITLAGVHHFGTDSALEQALKSPEPAVRYWGAKGLGGVINDLKSIGGLYDRAIDALRDAGAVEKSGPAAQQMFAALRAAATDTAGSPALNGRAAKALLDAETRRAAGFQHAAINDPAAEAEILRSLSAVLKAGMLPKPSIPAASTAANATSFAAHQLGANVLKPDDKAAAVDMVKAGIDAVDASSGSAYAVNQLTDQSDPGEIITAVDDFVGSGKEKGTLQAVLNVPIPPPLALPATDAVGAQPAGPS